MIDISKKGKGAIRETKPLFRKTLKSHLKKFGTPILPVQYSVKDLYLKTPIKDQGESSSCGGQAFSKYAEVKTFKRDGVTVQLSAKDIYQNVFVKAGGAYASDIIRQVQGNGICFESDISSYELGNPPSEAYMEKFITRSPQADTNALEHLLSNAMTYESTDIEQVKQAIYNGDGAVCALEGTNPAWTIGDGIVKVPSLLPTDSNLWGHFLVLCEWNDNTKLITAVNSWGTEAGQQGFYYIPYDYFVKGYGFSEWTEIILDKNYVSLLEKLIILLKEAIVLLKLKKNEPRKRIE